MIRLSGARQAVQTGVFFSATLVAHSHDKLQCLPSHLRATQIGSTVSHPVMISQRILESSHIPFPNPPHQWRGGGGGQLKLHSRLGCPPLPRGRLPTSEKVSLNLDTNVDPWQPLLSQSWIHSRNSNIRRRNLPLFWREYKSICIHPLQLLSSLHSFSPRSPRSNKTKKWIICETKHWTQMHLQKCPSPGVTTIQKISLTVLLE